MYSVGTSQLVDRRTGVKASSWVAEVLDGLVDE